MQHRSIGSLSVSVIGLGCNQLGTAACDEPTSLAVVADAVESGITMFDTSDEYGRNYDDPTDLTGWGRSEELLGRALAGVRDDVVIATKFGPVGPPDADGNPLFGDPRSEASTRGIRLAVEESLQRLGTDRIDLFQLHFPDPRFPISETLGALDELVRDGKVVEVGCSNFSPDQLREAEAAAHDHGTARFVSAQHPLSIVSRRTRDEIMPVCEELDLAFIPYWPLASGVLTGKYRRSEAPPAGSRLADQVDDATRAKILSDRSHDRVEALEAWALDHGRTILELAYAWLLGHPKVATVISGASRPGQPSANAAAGDWVLTPDEVDEVIGIVSAI